MLKASVNIGQDKKQLSFDIISRTRRTKNYEFQLRDPCKLWNWSIGDIWETASSTCFISSIFLLHYHYQHHHFSFHCCSECFSDDRGEDQISIESHQIEYLTGIVSVDWLPRWGRYSTTFHRRYNTPSIWSTRWILLVKVSHACIAKSDHSVSVPPGFDKWRKISCYETPFCVHKYCHWIPFTDCFCVSICSLILRAIFLFGWSKYSRPFK